MFYDFPKDISLDEVRSVTRDYNRILGCNVFNEYEKDEFFVFNYHITLANSFPLPITGDLEQDRKYAILRECRGLKFYKNGKIASRPYHKFHNINERDETKINVIDWDRAHCIMEKLDGSMFTPFLRQNGDIHFHSKMGFTEICDPVMDFVKNNNRYEKFARDMIGENQTAIFEWCSMKQKIVLNYPVDRLVLTAIRDNYSGQYMPYGDMNGITRQYDIDIVNVVPCVVSNSRINQFLEEARNLKNEEGYVVRFDNGAMCKVKADEYVRIHRSKETMNLEKDVMKLILTDKIDDIKPHLDDGDRKAVESFQNALEHRISSIVDELSDVIAEFRKNYGDDPKDRVIKKIFAQEIAKNYEPFLKTIIFMLYDGLGDQIRSHLAGYTINATKVEILRKYLKLNWFDYRGKVEMEA